MSYQPLSEHTTNKNVANGYCGLDGSGKAPPTNLPVMVGAGAGHQGGAVPPPDTDPMGGADPSQLFLRYSAAYESVSNDNTDLNGRRLMFNGPPDLDGFFTVPSPGDFSVQYWLRVNAFPQPGFSLNVRVSWYELDGVTFRAKDFTCPTDNVGDSISGTVFVHNPYDHHIFVSVNYSDLAGPNPNWAAVFRVDYL
jgi:hypothetical protein